MQSHQDVSGLIKALSYPDPEIRGRAAVALRTLEATDAVPALHSALEDELDEQARKYMQEALRLIDQGTNVAQLAADKDLGGLIEALKSTQAETVIQATQVLGLMGDRLAVEPLVMLFQNATYPPDVRLAAAEALLELKSAPAVVTLLGALRREKWQVRRNAAAVLGQIQAIWAVKPLAETLNDEHPVVRRAAATALKRIGTAEAMIALRAKLTATAEMVPVAAEVAPAVQPAETAQPAAKKAPASREQFHFDEQPPVLAAREKTRSAAAERKEAPASDGAKSSQSAAKPETVEVIKTTTSHTTRPHTERFETVPTDTPTGRPILKPAPRPRRAVSADTQPIPVTSSAVEVPVPQADTSARRQNLIERMIGFLRRRSEGSS